MLEITRISALFDNYVFVLRDPETNTVAVVDPAESRPVVKFLKERNLRLNLILNTHHHSDHVGGNKELKDLFGCEVIASKYDEHRIKSDRQVKEGDEVMVGNARGQVLFVPGHTSGHISYYFAQSAALFVGDTLFAMGCGRLFEGTPAQMFESLGRIKRLPPETKIYCAHEYTEKNARFALEFDGENEFLLERFQGVLARRKRGEATVPFTLGDELKTNPFLRASGVQEFADLRDARNNY